MSSTYQSFVQIIARNDWPASRFCQFGETT